MNNQAASVHEAKPPSILVSRSASFLTRGPAATCEGLLAGFARAAAGESRLLHFDGVDGRDVYNITAPFQMEGLRMIAGRVENRDSEIAQLTLFSEIAGRWSPCFTSPMLSSLQDPCVTFVGDELILGGVRYPVKLPGGSLPGAWSSFAAAA